MKIGMCLTSKFIYVPLTFFMNENPSSLHIYKAIFFCGSFHSYSFKGKAYPIEKQLNT